MTSGISWETLEELLPFSFAISPACDLIFLGRNLKKAFAPLSLPTHAGGFIQIEHPRVAWDFSAIDAKAHDLFVATLRGSTLKLRGGVHRLQDEVLLFQMSPAITDVEQFLSAGFRLQDLPLSDSSLDLIVSLRAHRLALEEVNQLVSTVEERSRDLAIAHDQLAVALENERSATKIKTRFLSMFSHEFRTPMTVAHTVAEIFERKLGTVDPDKIYKHGVQLRRAMEELSSLLDQISFYAKVEERKLQVNRSPMELHSFLRELAASGMTSETSVSIECLPVSPPDPLLINSDKTLLRIILRNLLSNAIKYSNTDGKVTLHAYPENGYAVIEISDQGVGISKATQQTIFEPYVRGENVGLIPGSGLGLAIVDVCMQLLQGEILLQSQLDHGTTIQLRFLNKADHSTC
jgi:signal transduction histidine kinase